MTFASQRRRIVEINRSALDERTQARIEQTDRTLRERAAEARREARIKLVGSIRHAIATSPAAILIGAAIDGLCGRIAEQIEHDGHVRVREA